MIKSPLYVIPPCMLAVALSYGLARYSLGLFLPTIRTDLDITVAVVSTIISASYIGYLLSTLIASYLSGRIGPRLLVLVGGLSATSGLALIAATSSIWLMGFGVLIAGMSPGLIYPPLSDAITRLVRTDQRDWVYSVVNSGTSIGIILCVPLALLLSDDWRLIYASFAVFSAIITVWATLIVPTGAFVLNDNEQLAKITVKWLFNGYSSPLFISAFIYGVASSTIWTFAPDLLNEMAQFTNTQIAIFWLVLGVGGLLGGAAASFIVELGLTKALFLGISLSLAATAALPVLPNFALAVSLSATLFGASFIMVTGLYGVWSMYVFKERPSAGFGLVFLIISVGQFFGTLGGGHMIDWLDYKSTFLISAAIGTCAFIFRPRKETNSSPTNQVGNLSEQKEQ